MVKRILFAIMIALSFMACNKDKNEFAPIVGDLLEYQVDIPDSTVSVLASYTDGDGKIVSMPISHKWKHSFYIQTHPFEGKIRVSPYTSFSERVIVRIVYNGTTVSHKDGVTSVGNYPECSYYIP